MFIRLKDTWWRVSFPPSSQPPSTHPQQPLCLFLSPLSSLRHRVTNTYSYSSCLLFPPSKRINSSLAEVLFTWSQSALVQFSSDFLGFMDLLGSSVSVQFLSDLENFHLWIFQIFFLCSPLHSFRDSNYTYISLPTTSEPLHCYLLHVTDEDTEASGGWQTCPEPHREGVDGSGLPQHLGSHWLAHTPSSCSP